MLLRIREYSGNMLLMDSKYSGNVLLINRKLAELDNNAQYAFFQSSQNW